MGEAGTAKKHRTFWIVVVVEGQFVISLRQKMRPKPQVHPFPRPIARLFCQQRSLIARMPEEPELPEEPDQPELPGAARAAPRGFTESCVPLLCPPVWLATPTCPGSGYGPSTDHWLWVRPSIVHHLHKRLLAYSPISPSQQ